MRDLAAIKEELKPAKVYQVVAKDSSGAVASQGRVPAEKLQKAIRLFTDEGWTVEVTPLEDEQT